MKINRFFPVITSLILRLRQTIKYIPQVSLQALWTNVIKMWTKILLLLKMNGESGVIIAMARIYHSMTLIVLIIYR